MRRLVAWTALSCVPCWIAVVIVQGWSKVDSPHADAATVANVVLFVSWVALTAEVWRSRTRCSAEAVPAWRRPLVWLAAATVVSPATTDTTSAVMPVVVGESTTALSPALASWSLAQLLQSRRMSIMSLRHPRRLSDDELRTLALFRREARALNTTRATEVAIEVEPVLPASIAMMIDTGNRETTDTPVVVEMRSAQQRSNDDWVFLVHVMGRPEVVTRDGRRVTFRKGRSLELLVWLVLNRDRMSRSLARTALWDIDVSDSTFSTVLSEMRRALNEAAPAMPREEISHATFSDEIHLNPAIVTDSELLAEACTSFAGDETSAARLANALSTVRGLPFAGQTYEWADLDGTTTRVVITVIEAATRLGHWALENSRHDLATVALTAGMRMMPGHPELASLEQRMLASVRG